MGDTFDRQRRNVEVALYVFGALAAACGSPSGPSDRTTAATESLTLRLDTTHFRLYAGDTQDVIVRGIGSALEEIQPRVLADLELASMRPVSVRIWQNEASFLDAMQAFLGQRFNATGYVTGPDELRVLAVANVQINSTHEMCHAASLYVSPSFGNNPRWFWESVALYENREFVNPRTLSYLANGATFPTLSQLNADPNSSTRIYDLGFVLGEFIVSRVGQSGLVRLIRANGDTVTVMGLSAPEFEAAFAAYVRTRYLN